MSHISLLNSLTLPPDPTWKGSVRTQLINASEFLFSFPLSHASYTYAADLKLQAVSRSTLQKMVQLACSILFIYTFQKQPVFIALAVAPKLYNRFHLPEPPPVPQAPPRSKPKMHEEHLNLLLSLVNFHIRHKQLKAALKALETIPYNHPSIELKKLEIYLLLQDHPQIYLIAERLIQRIDRSDEMERFLPQMVKQLLERRYSKLAKTLIEENRFPESVFLAKYEFIIDYLDRNRPAKAQALLEELNGQQVQNFLYLLVARKEYQKARYVLENLRNHGATPLVRAIVYAHLDAHQKAHEMLAEITPQSPLVQMEVAKLLIRLGKKDQAYEMIKAILLSLTDQEGNSTMRDRVRKMIIAVFLSDNQTPQAAAIIRDIENVREQSIQYVHLIKSYQKQGKTLLIQDILRLRGLIEQAVSLGTAYLIRAFLALNQIALAEKTIAALSTPLDRSRCQFELCKYYLKKEQIEEAKNILGQIETPRFSIYAQLALAETLTDQSPQEGFRCAEHVLNDLIAYPVDFC